MYNDYLEEDKFGNDLSGENEESKQHEGVEAEQLLAQEGAKVQLVTMYNEMVEDFKVLKPRIQAIVKWI